MAQENLPILGKKMKNNKYRWTVVIIFFFFMLLHQTDKLLINPLATQIYEEWNLTDTQGGAISTAALIVGLIKIFGF